MPVTLKKTVAVLEGDCPIADADPLREYLESNPKAKVNLKSCTCLHASVLQVLMYHRPTVSVPPEDPFVQEALLPAFAN